MNFSVSQYLNTLYAYRKEGDGTVLGNNDYV